MIAQFRQVEKLRWRVRMIDKYTKGVLTVIAAALVVLVVEQGIGRVSAQTDRIQKVQICDHSGCVGVVPYSLKIGTQNIRLNSLDVVTRQNKE
jgi:hypothetical protein